MVWLWIWHSAYPAGLDGTCEWESAMGDDSEKQEGNSLSDLRGLVFAHGHTWSHMVTSGQNWSHMVTLVTTGHIWSHLVTSVTPGHTNHIQGGPFRRNNGYRPRFIDR